MAGKIYNYFLKAGEIGGVKATTKLQELTEINSVQAISISDSEENIKIFELAMTEINRQFKGGSTTRRVREV